MVAMGQDASPRDEDVFRAVADASTDVITVIGRDGGITWRRQHPVRRPTRVDDAELLGDSLVERIHPDDLVRVGDELARLRDGEVSELHFSCRLFDLADRTLLYDTDVHAIDARGVDGVDGLLIMARIQDTRRAFIDVVHSDDFSLASMAPIGLALVSDDNRIVYANERFRTQLDLRDRNEIGVTGVVGLHDLIADARTNGAAERLVEVKGSTLRVAGRGFDRDSGNIVLSTDDITAEVEAIEHRLRSEQTWRATFDHTPAGIALVDTDGSILEVNPAWTAITGHAADDLVGHAFEGLRADRADSYRVDTPLTHADGSQILVDLSVALVRQADGSPLHYVAQILDITEARHREERLSHEATHDHLTGLPNRALIEELLRVTVGRAERGGPRPAVLAIDLDGFKPVNDRFGHAEGDRVLCELAARMTSVCRRGDTVGRVGGDEFVAITEDGGDGGRALAERLLAAIARPLPTPEPMTLTGSIGIAVVHPDDSVASVLARADAASYAAKAAGGGTIS